jgi:hypothetical protein
MHSWQERVANAPSREKASFPCSVVWGSRAGQLIIDVNCNVIPCCYAGGQGITFGNLREASLKEIYTSPAFTDFYEKHWDGDLSGYPLCNRCVEPFPAASPDEQTRLAVWQGELLAGRKVYFWGCGETYRKYRQYFARAKPQAFLLDIDECVGMYDDLPVRHPDNVLKSGEKLPVVIFAAPENNERILSTIKEKYPCLNRQDLICCPADLGEKRRCVTAPLHIISPPPRTNPVFSNGSMKSSVK